MHALRRHFRRRYDICCRLFAIMRRPQSGFTPLHAAAKAGAVECCTALLEAGARVDARSKRVGTACAPSARRVLLYAVRCAVQVAGRCRTAILLLHADQRAPLAQSCSLLAA